MHKSRVCWYSVFLYAGHIHILLPESPSTKPQSSPARAMSVYLAPCHFCRQKTSGDIEQTQQVLHLQLHLITANKGCVWADWMVPTINRVILALFRNSLFNVAIKMTHTVFLRWQTAVDTGSSIAAIDNHVLQVTWIFEGEPTKPWTHRHTVRCSEWDI